MSRQGFVFADDMFKTSRDWHGTILTPPGRDVSIAISREIGWQSDVARILPTADDTRLIAQP
jgi:hypothetical protein